FHFPASFRCLHSFPTRRSSDLDWIEEEPSWDINASIELSKALEALGAAYIHVSSAGLHIAQKIDIKPSYQVPFAAAIKPQVQIPDRKSTRLNSSHVKISYAVFC